MWPSPYTLYFLLLGLVPLVFVLNAVFRIGAREVTSLRFVGVLFLWVGYHLSPWMAYFSDTPWRTFLLAPAFIDDGLLFSSLCMLAFLAGYQLKKRAFGHMRAKGPVDALVFPRIEPKWLAIAAVLSLGFFVVSVGGISEIWASSRYRGEGQFAARDFSGRISQMVVVVSGTVHIVLASMAALFILSNRGRPARLMFGWACILVASLKPIHGFSRGSGFSLLILAFLALRMRGRRGALMALPAVFLAIYLGSVGLFARGSGMLGLGSFFQAAIAENQGGVSARPTFFVDASSNPLNAMEPWTRKIESLAGDRTPALELGFRFFWNLHPFPSEIVPIAPIGQGLADIMGTVGSSTNITTPALAEVYYVFGHAGAILMIFLGWAMAWFEILTVRYPGLASSVCLLLCFVSLPVGIHSSMRAMTRPLLYALMTHFVLTFVTRRRKIAWVSAA